MPTTLFFLHVPKCAGMSLMEALLKQLPANELYQSTSMVRNFWENRPEFLLLPNPVRLRAVVGHWIREEMLPSLRRPVFFATSIRDPIERIKSQYRFDLTLREGSWGRPSTSEFLHKNRNAMCWILNNAFPSVASQFDNQLDGAKAVLSSLDCVFDISEADFMLPVLLRKIGIDVDSVERANETTHVAETLPATDEEIAPYCENDIALYDWFMDARKRTPPDSNLNPVFVPERRQFLTTLVDRAKDRQAFTKSSAKLYAAELFYGVSGGRDPRPYVADLHNFSQLLSFELNELYEKDDGGGK